MFWKPYRSSNRKIYWVDGSLVQPVIEPLLNQWRHKYILLIINKNFKYLFFCKLKYSKIMLNVPKNIKKKKKPKNRVNRFTNRVNYRFTGWTGFDRVWPVFDRNEITGLNRTGYRTGSRFNRSDRPVRSGFQNIGWYHVWWTPLSSVVFSTLKLVFVYRYFSLLSVYLYLTQ